MSTNRIKKSMEVCLTCRADAERTMNIHADTANLRRALVAEMDARLIEVKADYETRIAKLDALINATAEDLQAWAVANPEEFGKKKSIELLAGTLGFRTGTPKLALLNRRWTWDLVLAAIEQLGFQFTRIKTEVDKEAILSFVAEASDKEAVTAKVLTPIGVKVTQGESFFIEPKLTDPQSAPVAA